MECATRHRPRKPGERHPPPVLPGACTQTARRRTHLKNEGGHARAQSGRGVESEVPPDNLDFLSPKPWDKNEYQHSQQRPRDRHHSVSSTIHLMTVPHCLTPRFTRAERAQRARGPSRANASLGRRVEPLVRSHVSCSRRVMKTVTP